MNSPEKSELKAETARKIEGLLKDLEEKTGDKVSDLCVKCINTTEDNAPKESYLRYVDIDMEIKLDVRWYGQ